MPASGYFVPTYYPPTFFGPLGAIAPGGAGSLINAYRDRDAFAALANILASSGEFAEVVFPGPVDPGGVGAGRTPLAVLAPTDWVEGADSASSVLLRRVKFILTLIVRHEDPRERFERLDRLTSVVQNAIEGSGLGGCLAGMTHLRAGRYEPTSRHPELRLTLEGGFCYAIPSGSGHGIAR